MQAGHRAELWDVNKWLAEVHIKLFRTASDDACIRLSDPATGDLFAECPVTLPLITSVEPVIDSSRYFVVRVVDRATSHHAFIGLGLRNREEASDFNAALVEHAQYTERKHAAAAMHEAYATARREAAADGSSDGAASDGSTGPPHPHADLALKPGETVTLQLNAQAPRTGGFVSSHSGGRPGTLTKTFSLMFDADNGCAVAALAPPPSSSRRKTAPMDLSPAHNGAAGAGQDAWGGFEEAGP